jgi:hypothetical protein
LAEFVHRPVAGSKDKLPLLKLGRFGDTPTDKGSLRYNANVLAVEGIEGDYDGEVIPIAEAAAKLRAAGISGLVYSSPSHRTDAPRWRVLCPFSSPLPPAKRERLCARLNGVLGGVLSGESFTLSQAYYYGGIEGSTGAQAELVDGIALDLATALDAGALGKDGAPFAERRELPTGATAEQLGDCDLSAEQDWPRIKSALAAIPVAEADEADGRQRLWLPIGLSLHAASGGSEYGFAVWDEWSRPGKKYDAKQQRKNWNGCAGDVR